MIKVSNIVGMGHVVYEDLTLNAKTTKKIIMGFPAQLNLVPLEEGNIGYQFIPAIPPFYKNHKNTTSKLRIRKEAALYTDDVSPDVEQAYETWVTRIKAAMSGLTVVGSDAMDKLPKDGKGEPVIPGRNQPL